MKNSKRKLSIFGSCISRDIFTFAPNATSVELIDYFARTTFVSLCAPVHKPRSELHLTSAFQKKIVTYDMKKSFLHKKFLANEYLLIDFIDERFRLVEFADGSIITYSNELAASKYLEQFTSKEYSLVENDLDNWKIFADSFCKQTATRKLILHEALWKEQYIDTNNHLCSFDSIKLEQIKKQNERLQTMQEFFKELVPKIPVVSDKKQR